MASEEDDDDDPLLGDDDGDESADDDKLLLEDAKGGNEYSIYIERQAKKGIVPLTVMGWHVYPMTIETAGWQDWCRGVHSGFGALGNSQDELSPVHAPRIIVHLPVETNASMAESSADAGGDLLVIQPATASVYGH